MAGDATFLSGLIAALQADIGSGSLVELSKHTAAKPRILRGRPPTKGDLPFIGVSDFPSVPLIKEVTHVKKYMVSICSFAAVDATAIKMGDRVERLFHNIDGANNGYFNFTSTEIRVYSCLWKARIKGIKDADLDSYEDENIIEIVCNPYFGC